jgi:3-deoxy-D-manno-octulosonic acid (KDO) 8-phosphate synthase
VRCSRSDRADSRRSSNLRTARASRDSSRRWCTPRTAGLVGALLEAHVCPEKSPSDADQVLELDDFGRLINAPAAVTAQRVALAESS